MIGFTDAQKNRLMELGVGKQFIDLEYDTAALCQSSFQRIENKGVKKNKAELSELFQKTHKVALCDLMEKIANALCEKGFTQVVTPTIISAKSLDKMSVTSDNPLRDQVFWVDKNACLRPMLAPNLYDVSKKLMGNQTSPLRLFEIGSCFRKESEGKTHLKEFTMLDLVEWGTPTEERMEKLKEYAEVVLKAAGIDDFDFVEEDSVVYGLGLDVVGKDGLELASTSMGPHPLDAAWKIMSTWVGIGFGLERLLMYREKKEGIHSYSRSNVFMNGACLKLN